MIASSTLARPLPGVSGEGDSWESVGGDAWFELIAPRPTAGRWLRLTWATSFGEALSRGMLRFVTPAGETSLLLAAPVLGRATWIGMPPAGTERILFSPTDRRGPFRFRLLEFEVLSVLGAFREAFARSPARAVLGLLEAGVGLSTYVRINFEIALKPVPLAAYPVWRSRNLRAPEPEGLDRIPPEAQATGVLLAAGSEFLADADDRDLVALAPEGSKLTPQARIALAAAALADPEADGFYGDTEIHGADGLTRACRFAPGGGPTDHAAVFWRVSRWRQRRDAPHAPRFAPVFRPLISVPDGISACPRPDGATTALPPPEETTIVIPTRDRLALLKACVDSLMDLTTDPFRLVIVDNNSQDPEVLRYLDSVGAGLRGAAISIQVRQAPGPFNFSALCNAGAAMTASPFLVFLNNDTTVLTPDWLGRMQAEAAKPGVGAVGAKLLFPSGEVQHAGVVLGINGIAGHFESGLPADDPGVFGRRPGPHCVSAVTGACLMIRRDRFETAGGFDETDYPIELNDIDLCLRLQRRGLRNALSTDVMLTHHESASRGRTDDEAYPKERSLFRRTWGQVIRGDPAFHPALSLYDMTARLP